MNDLFKVVDRTDEFDTPDIAENKVMGILAYIGILVLVPIFAAKESPYARFHANQGLVIFIGEAATAIGLGILSLIPYIGWLFATLQYLICTGFAVLSVFGIVFVAMGKARELPVVGRFKLLK